MRLTFIYDTSLGTSYSDGISNYVRGGAFFGVATPLLSATATIDGVDRAMPNIGSSADRIYGYQSSSLGEQTHSANSLFRRGNVLESSYFSGHVYAYDGTITNSLEGPFVIAQNGNYFGELIVDIVYFIDGFDSTNTYFRATFDRLTVGPAFPEPSTWAMMLIGFAGLGYAARRRREDRLTA